MPASLDRELAAAALLDAAYTTDEKACAKYGISVRSLQRWRRQLADGDPELAGSVATKKEAFDKAWADELPIALKKAILCLNECMDTLSSDPVSKKNPEVIRAVAGAMSICADIYLTSKVIDGRINLSDSGSVH
jgi:transposase-like protein